MLTAGDFVTPKSLVGQFHCSNGDLPKRLVVYLQGGSDGEAYQDNINTIKKVFIDEKAPVPPITFAVAVTQHNLRVVPAVKPNNRNKKVLGGTCVSYPAAYARPNHANGVGAFLFTPHGGLKGTSKPVLYQMVCQQREMLFWLYPFIRWFVCLLASPSRQTCVVMNVYHENVNVGLCLFQSMNSHIVPHPHRYAFRCRRIIQILNENIVTVDGCSQLTPDNFQKMTYWMSFLYGTATKAVRLVPVLYYSERLANSIQHVPSV